jgi:ABC-type polysaccharide/polyol phosphate export permease
VTLSDVASVSVKALPWAFFIGSIRFGAASLTGNATLIRKIYFPQEVFPISAVLAHLVDFGVAAATLTVILAVARIGVSVHLLWLPVLVAILVLITVAIAMFLACANVFFRDVKYLVEVILTFGIFFTPVFYESKMLGPWASVVLLNPVGALLEAINDVVVLHRAPDPFWVGYAFVFGVVALAVSQKVFDQAEYAFAEIV